MISNQLVKTILKKLRKNRHANRFISGIIKKVYNVVSSLTDRWTPSGEVEVEFNDIKFVTYCEADDYVLGNLYYNKPVIESPDISTFLGFAQRSRTILDIGANVGIYSVLSAKVNIRACIYAFEPNEVNARRLRKNIDLNHLPNIRVVEKAIGDKPGMIDFTVPVAPVISDSSSVLEEFSKSSYGGSIEWKKVPVQQTTIDAFLVQEGVDSVDLIKIDVEGYEMMVVKGALECIKSHKPVIQCEIFVDADRKEFFDAFSCKYAYTPYILMSEGLLRLDGGIQPQKGHNFIFLQQSFTDVLTPVEKAMSLLYHT